MTPGRRVIATLRQVGEVMGDYAGYYYLKILGGLQSQACTCRLRNPRNGVVVANAIFAGQEKLTERAATAGTPGAWAWAWLLLAF